MSDLWCTMLIVFFAENIVTLSNSHEIVTFTYENLGHPKENLSGLGLMRTRMLIYP
jgi:hypothetical protein